MKNDFNYELQNDTEYMLKKIREYYGYYTLASDRLKTNQIFSLDAIYQCITQLDNDENHSSKERNIVIYNDFCKRVSEQSGINYKFDSKDGYRVIRKTKKNPFSIFKN